MKVRVKLSWPISKTVGARSVDLEMEGAPAVADALARLAAGYPGFERELAAGAGGGAVAYALFLNGSQIRREDAGQLRLADGDELYIILPVVGGEPAPRLPRDFFNRPPLVVARELLGQRLVRTIDGRRLSGLIVETEAYAGLRDQASHAYRNPTGRAAIMFGPPGFAYVYQIYNHDCLNAVTEGEGTASAVLIRGVWPEEGIEEMIRRRGHEPGASPALPPKPARSTVTPRVTGATEPPPPPPADLRWLTDGPGKLCQALGIGRDLNGTDLVDGEALFVESGRGFADERVLTGPRIGVTGDEMARTRPWRFYVPVRLRRS